MATYSTCYSETINDLFSEIDPAYVSLVNSSLRTLAGICFAFVKVVHSNWHERFGCLPGASSRNFLRNSCPSFLRKVKNLVQLADAKLASELPKTLASLSSSGEQATPWKASDKFNCSFATFIELLTTFIDSFFVALDCNLLTTEALQDLSKLENAECHIIAYCLYAARMWSNLPVQHIECFNRSCLEVTRLLKAAVDSPTMAAFKLIKSSRRMSTSSMMVPPTQPSHSAGLANQFTDAFSELVATVVELKSKQTHLLRLGKLREDYLTVSPTYELQRANDSNQGQASFSTSNSGGNEGSRKGSLPTQLLKSINFFHDEATQPMREADDAVFSDNKSSSAAGNAANCPDDCSVHSSGSSTSSKSSSATSTSSRSTAPQKVSEVETAVKLRRRSSVEQEKTDVSPYELPPFALNVNGTQEAKTVENEEMKELKVEIERLNSELKNETAMRMNFEQTMQTMEQHLSVSEAQLSVCRAELASENTKREALQREIATTNEQLKLQFEKWSLPDEFQPKIINPSGEAAFEELKARLEHLKAWSDHLLKTSQVLSAANKCLKTESSRLEERAGELERCIEQLQSEIFGQQTADGVIESIRNRAFDEINKMNNKESTGGVKHSHRRDKQRSTKILADCYEDACCFLSDDCCIPTSRGGGSGGGYVCIPVTVRCHHRRCNNGLCQESRSDRSKTAKAH